MERNLNNISDFNKYIFGKMWSYGLPVSNKISSHIEDIANDYCIGREVLNSILYQVALIYKNNKHLDCLELISYQIIKSGKEKTYIKKGKQRYGKSNNKKQSEINKRNETISFNLKHRH